MDTAFIGKVGDDDLGAALELVPEDLKPEWFEGCDYFHIEGYLVQNQATIRRAVELAKAAGSFILLILGKYKFIMAAITAFVSNAGALWGSDGQMQDCSGSPQQLWQCSWSAP